MPRIFDAVCMTLTGAGGASTLALGAAVGGAKTFAQAGANDGDAIYYSIQDLTAPTPQREEGIATYNASGPTLSNRSVISSTNGNAAINATSNAIVFSSILAENVGWFNYRNAVTANYTVKNSDKGSTIALGGNSFYALTFGPASNYDANFSVMVVNEDLPPGGFTLLWNAQQTFNLGDQVLANDTFEYTSLVDNNIGNNPDTDGGIHWRLGGAPTIWVGSSTSTYDVGQQCIGFDGHRYQAIIQNTNVNPVGDGGIHWLDLGAQGRGKLIQLETPNVKFILYPQRSAIIFVQDGVWQVHRDQRWAVPSTTIFYFDVAGSDTNDGLAPTIGAFMSPQFAINSIFNNVDFSYQNVFLQGGIGTFGPPEGALPGTPVMSFFFPWTGGGSFIIAGYPVLDAFDHFTTKFSVPSGAVISLTAPCAGGIQIGEITIESTGTADGVRVVSANSFYISNVEFGPLGNGRGCVALSAGAQIIFNGPAWITGFTAQNFSSVGGGYIQLSGNTITLGSSVAGGAGPAGSVFFNASDGGVIEAVGVTYNGNFSAGSLASAYKYTVSINGIIDAGGASNSIPGTLTYIAPGSGGQVDDVNQQQVGLQGYIGGLGLTNNDQLSITVAPGLASSSDGATVMTLPTQFTKYLSANWAQGSGVIGGLDTGTLASNTWYAVFLIQMDNALVTDIIVTKETAGSFPSPLLPAGWLRKRYIGSIRTDVSSHILDFTQTGDDFTWAAPVLDISNQTLNMAAGSDNRYQISVPLGLKVKARTRGYLLNTSDFTLALIYSPDEGDPASALTTAGFNIGSHQISGSAGYVNEFNTITDTSGRIGAVGGTAGNVLYLNTIGWNDSRGRYL